MRKGVIVFLAVFLLFSCAKKIPPPETFDPEKSFASANELLKKKKYDEGRRELFDLIRRETEIKYAPLARLRIADSYADEGEPELATGEYKKFLDEYPGHRYAPYAQYKTAMVHYVRIKDPERSYGAAEKALDEFERLIALYPRNPYRDEVLPYIKRSEEVLADHEFMVGDFYYGKEAWQGALDRLLGLIERFPDYSRRTDVIDRIVGCYEALGDMEKARQYRGGGIAPLNR